MSDQRTLVTAAPGGGAKRFGAFGGVFTPSILRRASFHPVCWRPNLVIFGGSQVRILTVVPSEKRKATAERELAGIMAQTRLAAESRVLVRRAPDIAEVMREESGRSDLVMVGLRQPRPDEQAADFFAHYSRILGSLPTTMLVASAPSFEGAPVLFEEVEEGAGDAKRSEGDGAEDEPGRGGQNDDD